MRLPRIDTFGKWYVPGFNEDGHWGSTLVVYLQKEGTSDGGRNEICYKKLGWDDFSQCKSPLEGNFTYESDRLHVKALLERYMVVYNFFYRMFIEPMRTFEGNWDAYMDKNCLLLPQLMTKSTHDMRSDPDFSMKRVAEWLLPTHYPCMLHDSIAGFENRHNGRLE